MIQQHNHHIHNVDHNLDHLDRLQGQYWGCLAAQLDAARLSHFECWGRERVGEERLREVGIVVTLVTLIIIAIVIVIVVTIITIVIIAEAQKPG